MVLTGFESYITYFVRISLFWAFHFSDRGESPFLFYPFSLLFMMVLDKPASGFTSAEVGSSLMSAQSLQPYKDFPHGSPPGYSDSDHRGLPTGLAIPVPVPSPLLYQVPEGHVASSRRTSQTCVVSVSPRLSSNPEALYELIVQQAKLPPQPHVTIKGTHMRTRWNGNQGTTKETVIDFDFRIEATSTALRMYDPDDGGGEETLNQPFRRLVVAQDRDGVKTYRGGRCKSKGKFKGKTNVGGDVEGYQSGAGTMLGLNEPTLREWCERFHRNRAAVKSSVLLLFRSLALLALLISNRAL